MDINLVNLSKEKIAEIQLLLKEVVVNSLSENQELKVSDIITKLAKVCETPEELALICYFWGMKSSNFKQRQ